MPILNTITSESGRFHELSFEHSSLYVLVEPQLRKTAAYLSRTMAITMQAEIQKLWLSTSTLLVVGLVSCGSLASVGIGVINIGDIRQKWNAYSTVRVQGKVGDRIPLLGAQVYEIEDSTGTIWVLTKEPTPNAGDQVLVEAKVRHEDISINAQDFGEAYLIEEKRLKTEPAPTTSEPPR